MSQTAIFLTILGMMAVTYAPRLIPALCFANRLMPLCLRRFLAMVPPAVLGALLCQSVLLDGTTVRFTLDNVLLWGALTTAILAWRTKGFFGPVAAGMAVVALLRLI